MPDNYRVVQMRDNSYQIQKYNSSRRGGTWYEVETFYSEVEARACWQAKYKAQALAHKAYWDAQIEKKELSW